jgi:hypothetical protein
VFVYKLNSAKLVKIQSHKYRIDWNCPSASKFQFQIKQFLKPFWQFNIVLEEFRVPGSLLRCDLVNVDRKLIVEASGDQHKSFNKFFHNNSRVNYLNQIKKDFAKQEWAERNKFTFIEIYESDLPLTKGWFMEKYGVEI